MDHPQSNNSPLGLWSGSRVGSRRLQQTARDAPSRRSSTPPAAAPPAQQQPKFEPHQLQLKPGDTVGGGGVPLLVGAGGGSIDGSNTTTTTTSSYRLESEVHRGPRSAVWKATGTNQQPVVLKLLGLGSPQQAAAATQELSMMQQLSGSQQQQPPSSLPAGGSDASTSTSSSTTTPNATASSSHLVRLLDAFMAQQPQHNKQVSGQQQLAPSPAQAAAHSSCIINAAAAGSSSVSAVALVLPQLHQSLSWVLHWVHQRNGRNGLPDVAVRSFAHQLLSALAELHDGHALVHRDVKPSNVLLQQPFVVRTAGKKHLMRSMTGQELSAAQWTLVDLGSAGRLLPCRQQAADESQPPAALNHQQHRQQGVSWLGQLWGSFLAAAGKGQPGGRAAAATPSGLRWQVAPGDVTAYETAAYAPPEAILHCPATAAYDVWSAACTIYEAATGRTLFPVEAAATARRSITDCVYTHSRQGGADGDSSDSNDDASSTQLDEVHLALIKGVCTGGGPIAAPATSRVSQALFADAASGRLWLSEEEKEVQELRAWRQRWCRPSLLQHLMARRTMSLQQALDLVGLLEPMLRWDPAARPSAAELLRHPYFEPLRCREEL